MGSNLPYERPPSITVKRPTRLPVGSMVPVDQPAIIPEAKDGQRGEGGAEAENGGNGDPPPPPPPPQGKAKLMAGERELTSGMLSKDVNFRLIVNGPVGVKEILAEDSKPEGEKSAQ